MPQLTDSRDRYGLISRIFHWGMALLTGIGIARGALPGPDARVLRALGRAAITSDPTLPARSEGYFGELRRLMGRIAASAARGDL